MAEQTIISWNFANWITIILMAIVGFLVLAALAQVWHSWRGTGSNNEAPGNLVSGASLSMG